jgi:hypothetical protein
VTAPIRISCSDISNVPATKKIRSLASQNRHVVLKFPRSLHIDKITLVRKLASDLPDFSVFDSGGDIADDWVTILPVVDKAIVEENSGEIKAAAKAYVQSCEDLTEQYVSGRLASEWSFYDHGEHRRFKNSKTGQVVDSPLNGSHIGLRIDPYFFAEFVKTTCSQQLIARFIKHDFHDAARMIHIVFGVNHVVTLDTFSGGDEG